MGTPQKYVTDVLLNEYLQCVFSEKKTHTKKNTKNLKIPSGIYNSVDPDQTAPSRAV